MPAFDFDAYNAFELEFEQAAAAILVAGGFAVVSPFAPIDPDTGAPNLTGIPDRSCIVEFEAGEIADDVRAFRTDATLDSGLASEPALGTGTLKITHRVPVGDLPTAAGDVPGCYEQLLIQRGKIRTLFMSARRPFQAHALYDVLSITLTTPSRRVDGERHANQATESFRLTWMPREGLWTA